MLDRPRKAIGLHLGRHLRHIVPENDDVVLLAGDVTDVVAQQGFRDITTGATDFWAAGPGWDVPTGWGSPRAASLVELVP